MSLPNKLKAARCLLAMDLTTCSSFKARRLKPDQNPFRESFLCGIGAVLVGNKCFVFGGNSEEPTLIYIYDSQKNSWTSKHVSRDTVTYGQVKMSFTVDDTLFAYVRQYIDRVYYLVNLDLVNPDSWDVVQAQATPNLTFGVSDCYVERRGEAVVTTPYVGLTPTTVVVYRVNGKSWYSPRVKGKNPMLAADHSSCASGLTVFVMGENRYVDRLNLHVLDVTALPFVWSTPETGCYFPKKRYLFGTSCTVNRIFVYGGFNGKTSFDVYSISDQRWLENLEFDTDWESGTADNAVVQTAEKIIVFAGLRLPARTPLEITPA